MTDRGQFWQLFPLSFLVQLTIANCCTATKGPHPYQSLSIIRFSVQESTEALYTSCTVPVRATSWHAIRAVTFLSIKPSCARFESGQHG